jgi:hypothetical protein
MKHKRSLLSICMASIMLVSLCAVVGTTSVSAATSSANATTSTPANTSASAAESNSSANAITSAGLVGAPAGIVGAPAVCSRDANSLDLFIRGTDNALWWRHWDGMTNTWSAWASLGGYLTSDPGAAAYGGDALFVCARGGDGAFYYRTGPSWGSWHSFGGQLLAGTGPAVISSGGYVYGPAIIGTNHQLYWWWNGAWKSLGGYLTSSPSGASPVGNSFTIAARGGDGALWSVSTSSNFASWSWTSRGGQLLAGTGPAVVYDGVNIRYAVTGTNHQLYWSTGSGWTSLGGYLTSGPAAASESTNKVDVFALGNDSHIWSRNTTDGGSSWNPWYKLPA